MTSSSRLKQHNTWYAYEDWTLEDVPRCFYCGKGDYDRVDNLKRNSKHEHASRTLGLRRVIILETHDEAAALAKEIELIALHHTYVYDEQYNGVGCNFTRGGEGEHGINAKPILKCSTDGTIIERFASVREASQDAGVNLTGYLTGNRRLMVMGGFTWRYDRAEHVSRPRQYRTRANCKPVSIIEGGTVVQTYASIAEAATAIGVRSSTLSGVIRGLKPLSALSNTVSVWPNTRTVVYQNADSASKGVGRKQSTQERAHRSQALRDIPKSAAHRAKISKARSKPVVKLFEGEVVASYPTTREARVAEGFGKSTMTMLVRTGKIRDGHTWKYVEEQQPWPK